jgi:hypothetical protein
MRSPAQLVLLLLTWGCCVRGLLWDDEQRYLQLFPAMVQHSYEAPLPSFVQTHCRDQGLIAADLATTVVSVQGDIVQSEQLQALCGTNTHCVVTDGTRGKLQDLR